MGVEGKWCWGSGFWLTSSQLSYFCFWKVRLLPSSSQLPFSTQARLRFSSPVWEAPHPWLSQLPVCPCTQSSPRSTLRDLPRQKLTTSLPDPVALWRDPPRCALRVPAGTLLAWASPTPDSLPLPASPPTSTPVWLLVRGAPSSLQPPPFLTHTSTSLLPLATRPLFLERRLGFRSTTHTSCPDLTTFPPGNNTINLKCVCLC